MGRCGVEVKTGKEGRNEDRRKDVKNVEKAQSKQGCGRSTGRSAPVGESRGSVLRSTLRLGAGDEDGKGQGIDEDADGEGQPRGKDASPTGDAGWVEREEKRRRDG